MKNRRDFIRNSLMALAASMLPKPLLPQADMLDGMRKAHLKLQSAINKEPPPGSYLVFENGYWCTKEMYDKMEKWNAKRVSYFYK